MLRLQQLKSLDNIITDLLLVEFVWGKSAPYQNGLDEKELKSWVPIDSTWVTENKLLDSIAAYIELCCITVVR